MEKIKQIYPSRSYDIKDNPWLINISTGVYGYKSIDSNCYHLVGAVGIRDKVVAEYIDIYCYKNKKLFFAQDIRILIIQ